ncbi:MAG: glycosyltransferase [Deltaproteobacteria bacterium]|nr:glycosyltransferase [Deltaproteobacteria bacterium]
MIGPDTTFSVVIPTHDRPVQLAACLRSLARLRYPNEAFEVIVVDDGSVTPLGPVVDEARGSLSLRVLRRPNGGPSAARNAGLAVARGRFVAFTDDDCRPEPGWLAAFERRLGDDAAALVGGRTVNALVDDPFASTSQLIVDLAVDHYNRDPEDARFFPASNLAVARDGLAALGGFAAELRTAEDRDLCDRWRALGRRLRLAPDAVVLHAHALDLRSFWRQHLGYGRGAWRFLRAHQRREGSSTIDAGFYLRTLRELPGRLAGQRQPARVAALLALWQLANTVGFGLEAAREALGAGGAA